MPTLITLLNADNAWPELKDKSIIHLANDAPPIQIGVLDRGMSSGRPSVAIRIDLPDGRYVIAETSARLFVGAARAIHARHPNLFDGE